MMKINIYHFIGILLIIPIINLVLSYNTTQTHIENINAFKNQSVSSYGSDQNLLLKSYLFIDKMGRFIRLNDTFELDLYSNNIWQIEGEIFESSLFSGAYTLNWENIKLSDEKYSSKFLDSPISIKTNSKNFIFDNKTNLIALPIRFDDKFCIYSFIPLDSYSNFGCYTVVGP